MDEKIIVLGKTKKSTLNLWLALSCVEIIFALIMIIAALSFDILFLIPISFFFLLLGIILLLKYRGSKKRYIIVTENRVYGTNGALFPTDFNLPMDSVSSVDSYRNSNGFAISTSSRTIAFADIDNAKKIVDEVSKLISNRNKKNASINVPQSNADELKKYKDLLDQGIITQEEFDAKKKQLLGL